MENDLLVGEDDDLPETYEEAETEVHVTETAVPEAQINNTNLEENVVRRRGRERRPTSKLFNYFSGFEVSSAGLHLSDIPEDFFQNDWKTGFKAMVESSRFRIVVNGFKQSLVYNSYFFKTKVTKIEMDFSHKGK